MILGAIVSASLALVAGLPRKGGKALNVLHIFITFHLVVVARIFFRSPDLETSKQFVDGLVAFDGLGVRPGLASVWVWLLLGFGLVYHFTPKTWVSEWGLKVFRKTPGRGAGPRLRGRYATA